MANLIITNGDSALARMREAGITDDMLAWRDVLHEGPVPLTSSMAELSKLRAAFIADCGWADRTEAETGFAKRDRDLASSADFKTVTLWFEHDLYDQLQLIQILDWFADHPRPPGTLKLVQADDYLGECDTAAIRRFQGCIRDVTNGQIDSARKAWSAFRQPTPQAFVDLLDAELNPLPCLRDARDRMLEELPCPRSGLTRLERTALQLVSEGIHRPAKLFAAYQHTEEARFLGDTSFYGVLDRLRAASDPALTATHGQPTESLPDRTPAVASAADPQHPYTDYLAKHFELTATGHDALCGRRDFLASNEPERWWGGTLLSSSNDWRWDAAQKSLIRKNHQW